MRRKIRNTQAPDPRCKTWRRQEHRYCPWHRRAGLPAHCGETAGQNRGITEKSRKWNPAGRHSYRSVIAPPARRVPRLEICQTASDSAYASSLSRTANAIRYSSDFATPSWAVKKHAQSIEETIPARIRAPEFAWQAKQLDGARLPPIGNRCLHCTVNVSCTLRETPPVVAWTFSV